MVKMPVDEKIKAEQRELTTLLMLALLSLAAGYVTGLTGGLVFGLSSLAEFLTIFGVAFAVFMVLVTLQAAAAWLKNGEKQ